MKGIKLLLAVLLAPLAFQAAADDASDIARAATRRSASTTITNNRQKPTTTPTKKATTASRATDIGKSGTTVRERTQTTTTTPRTGTTTTRTASTMDTKRVSARTATVTPRTIKTTQSRTMATTARTGTPTTRTSNKSRTATQPTRARTATATATTAPDMLNRDFSKCRTVFYDCMDEFCANKDTQLKRCACSSRIHEFDSTKQNLANVEEKLMDFSQRLITVNMEREDAEALYKPTEGELAYATDDTSASKKMLDEIAKKLNTSFNDSNFDQSLNAISLSLNMDSAFDTIDSMAGASTTAKSGTDLYVSALPICREMAMEVCSTDDLAIAESSYQMAIESDCNTVKKSYQTQVDQARTQVFESGALLDMSRLDIHQKRNSDDILTCKRKMLDMLTDSTVCGADMGKCLDTTGRYIDPTTGTAFLTTELYNLASLISRPESGQTWRTAPGNDRFITFLNSKKKFLEPAMEKCQDISDYVWDGFIDDALAQIKLAQESKLEEVRQSCTTLTAQCLDETYDSITEFDARALSIFGVAVDQTVNAMCADVQTACTALMQTSGGGENWQTGITDISTEKTYETILQTCREVGRACIIQACTSVTGNFGLCENIDTSINRKSIINRTACWDDVVECVASAGDDALNRIQKLHPLDTIENDTPDAGDTETRPNIFRTFYGKMYGKTPEWSEITLQPNNDTTNTCIASGLGVTNCVHDICTATYCTNSDQENPTVSTTCYACRLAERIWGNCEAPAKTNLSASNTYHNRIRATDQSGNTYDTLLAWFAKNTGTADAPDSCRDTSCRQGFTYYNGMCVPPGSMDITGERCGDRQFSVFADNANIRNCCGAQNLYEQINNNCCQSDATQSVNITDDTTYFGTNNIDGNTVCTTSGASQTNLIVRYTNNGINYNLVCLGTVDWTGDDNATDGYPNGQSVQCNGKLVLIDDDGHYLDPTNNNGVSSYYRTATDTCVYDGQTWKTCGGVDCATPDTWSIEFGDICSDTRA